MTVATLSRSGLSGAKGRRTDASVWQRPADWVALPAVNVGDQKFVGLHSVYDHDSNFVALSAAGAYTVDWGDGLVEDVATGAQANHAYNFAALPANTTTADGYRQAVVTVTPQGAGNLTALNLYLKHPQTAQPGYGTGWLDISIAGAALATLTIGPSTTVAHRSLQRFAYTGPSAILNFTSLLQDCAALQAIEGTEWTAAGTNLTNMFSGCSLLQGIPLLNTGAAVTLTGLFAGCRSLRSLPLLNTAACTNFTNFLNNCTALRELPLLNMAAATNLSFAFGSCSALRSIPLFNTAAVTNWSNTFNNCNALRTIPLLNTSAGTLLVSTFSGCAALSSIPQLDTGACTSLNGTFSGCTSLQTIPLLNTANVTNFNNTFNGCTSLLSIPLLNTVKGTAFGGMFQGCTSLQTVPALNLAAAPTGAFSNMFSGCVSLSRCAVTGVRFSHSYLNCRLSATELNRIYTNLAAGVVGQTITVTGNWGTAGDDPTIATAKGWTVTGS